MGSKQDRIVLLFSQLGRRDGWLWQIRLSKDGKSGDLAWFLKVG